MNADHGNQFYLLKVTRDISPDGEMGVFADSVTVGPDGSLLCLNHSKSEKFCGLIVPPGNWKLAVAVNPLNKAPEIVEWWAKEVEEVEA